jgi:hypothetical protein
MTKVLASYRANPVADNARKLRAYTRKHPMASCMLTPEDSALLRIAIEHANRADVGE